MHIILITMSAEIIIMFQPPGYNMVKLMELSYLSCKYILM